MVEELNIPSTFGRFRKDFKLTKSAVAAALGIQPPSYGYETEGKNNNPNAKTLFKLAKSFNVSVDYLLGLTDDPRPTDEILAELKSLKEKPAPAENDIAARLAALETQFAELKAAQS